MKIAFVSNFLSHHQIELCGEFKKKCREFVFLATDISNEQGYQTSNEAEYVIDYNAEKEKAVTIVKSYEVVIFGNCPNDLIKIRMDEDKLSFLYSERFFKKGVWRCLIPTTRKKVWNRIGQFRDKQMYVLSASAFLPYDLSLIGFPKEKCLKWGYFPTTRKYDIDQLISQKPKEVVRILWVGRMLSWKHPELAVKLASKLKQAGYTFKLSMIGDGPEKKKVCDQIQKQGLTEYVYLEGSKNEAEVRQYMEEANVFISTSDFYEGWGAVLNEAMNSGCAVVASHAAGSTPYLVEDSVNGMIFESENIEDMYKKVKELLDNDEERNAISTAAYESIINIWNSNVAVERFRKLTEVLLSEKKYNPLYESGPCSNAEILKNRWYQQ